MWRIAILIKLVFEIPPWWRITWSDLAFYLRIIYRDFVYNDGAFDVATLRVLRALACTTRDCGCYHCSMMQYEMTCTPTAEETQAYGAVDGVD